MIDANPSVANFRYILAVSNTSIGILLKETGKSGESLRFLEDARAILQNQAEINPAAIDVRLQLANVNLEVGDVFRLNSQQAEARASYLNALAIIDSLIKAQPTLTDYCLIYTVFGMKGLGFTQQKTDRPADAVASWRRGRQCRTTSGGHQRDVLFSGRLPRRPGSDRRHGRIRPFGRATERRT